MIEVDTRKHAGPYIGITGFTEMQQVLNLLHLVRPETGYRLMVGLLVSHKTLKGLPAKFPNRYPPLARLNGVFVDDPRTVNLAHFNSKTREGLADELAIVNDLCSPLLQGFQLNMTWPLNSELERARELCGRRFHYVIQINRNVIEEAGRDPKLIAGRLRDSYDPEIATDALIDASGGRARPLDSRFALDCIAAISEACPHTHIGIAGGLHPKMLDRQLSPFRRLPQRVSIDAEGGLRTSLHGVDDELDDFLAISYLDQAFGAFSGTPR